MESECVDVRVAVVPDATLFEVFKIRPGCLNNCFGRGKCKDNQCECYDRDNDNPYCAPLDRDSIDSGAAPLAHCLLALLAAVLCATFFAVL